MTRNRPPAGSPAWWANVLGEPQGTPPQEVPTDPFALDQGYEDDPLADDANGPWDAPMYGDPDGDDYEWEAF